MVSLSLSVYVLMRNLLEFRSSQILVYIGEKRLTNEPVLLYMHVYFDRQLLVMKL